MIGNWSEQYRAIGQFFARELTTAVPNIGLRTAKLRHSAQGITFNSSIFPQPSSKPLYRGQIVIRRRNALAVRVAKVLEEKLNAALVHELPPGVLKRARPVAIDYHEIPYHGEPLKHANELCRGKPKSGTTKFHAYATACIVEKGHRFTLAYTWGTLMHGDAPW